MCQDLERVLQPLIGKEVVVSCSNGDTYKGRLVGLDHKFLRINDANRRFWPTNINAGHVVSIKEWQ